MALTILPECVLSVTRAFEVIHMECAIMQMGRGCDYTAYSEFVRDLVFSRDLTSFKRAPQYAAILEHVSLETGPRRAS